MAGYFTPYHQPGGFRRLHMQCSAQNLRPVLHHPENFIIAQTPVLPELDAIIGYRQLNHIAFVRKSDANSFGLSMTDGVANRFLGGCIENGPKLRLGVWRGRSMTCAQVGLGATAMNDYFSWG